MSIKAFEGPAGTGKTHSLMNELEEAVRRCALLPHERVLALTFMHGSRRRLASRLDEIECVAGQFRATTLDSFAYRLCRRWRLLAQHLGHTVLAEDNYDATCDCAAALLKHPVVKSWIRTAYPHVVVDEAQDLSLPRSKMIHELTHTCNVVLAFDEFQCLDPKLRPMPAGAWLYNSCNPIQLDRCYRTEDSELLAAARAVREGLSIDFNGTTFSVKITPGRGDLAAALVSFFIAGSKGGSVAVLTPSRKGGFADKVVNLVASKTYGNGPVGPYSVRWQQSADAEQNSLWSNLGICTGCSIAEMLDRLRGSDSAALQSVYKWILRRQSILGVDEIAVADVRRQFDRMMALRRHYYGRSDPSLIATTIQQAKNREFDHVVIIWPYSIPNDDEQKRRLFYNAVTRAVRRCIVLVQSERLTKSPPFVGVSTSDVAVTEPEASVPERTYEQLTLSL